jgi:hypothetical protein
MAKSLLEKLLFLHPSFEAEAPFFSSFLVQNDTDGKGDYIAEWNHPTIPRPIDEELSALEPKP